MVSKPGCLLTQVNYSERCTFGGLQGWSLNTGDLKNMFDYISFLTHVTFWCILEYFKKIEMTSLHEARALSRSVSVIALKTARVLSDHLHVVEYSHKLKCKSVLAVIMEEGYRVHYMLCTYVLVRYTTYR